MPLVVTLKRAAELSAIMDEPLGTNFSHRLYCYARYSPVFVHTNNKSVNVNNLYTCYVIGSIKKRLRLLVYANISIDKQESTGLPSYVCVVTACQYNYSNF